MALIVQKYGGTSVGDVERIRGVAQRVKKYIEQGHQVVVVVSAMSGETNRLVSMGREIAGEQGSAREMDVLTASGEQVTISLLSLGLLAIGVEAKSFLADQVAIKTDDVHGKARIQEIHTAGLFAELERGCVPIIAGFQGVNNLGEITTLGRGGSDTSAVALAAALGADECEICTDVDGVYTTDPRIVESARRLSHITLKRCLSWRV
jgi:aspartate kinase